MRGGTGRSANARRASCAPAPGSAATVTAIRSSWLNRCAIALAQRVRDGARLVSRRSSTRWAPSCRSRPSWPKSPADVIALAEARGDAAASRADEPYRRALSGIYARLAATHLALTGKPAPRPATLKGEAYPAPARACGTISRSSRARSGGGGGAARLGRCARAADPRGRDLRLPPRHARHAAEFSAVHERVVAELLKVAGVEADYAALDEAARVALLRRELANARPLSSPFATYSEETATELAIIREAAARPCEIWPGLHRQLYRLDGAIGVRPARGAICCSRRPACTGPATGAQGRDHGGAAVRDRSAIWRPRRAS